ncbi:MULTISPECIES: siderophore-interacting protein [Phenylobacterium]|uniref:NADPH-dependent ferric siderophore reductase n=1 Tax=Phenylobacterium koreense TaxID=266125 RepID=A0ABV2EJW8_9CAUL
MSTQDAQSPPAESQIAEMMRRRGLKEWWLTVAATAPVTPLMRRVTVKVEGKEAFEPTPGQDMVLLLPDLTGNLGRRHYTIRRYDPASGLADIDLVIHSKTSPGARWALEAAPGDTVSAFGPRGRNVIRPGADWRLFVGDETCIPAIFGMIEALPAGATAHAIIEVADEGEKQALATSDGVTIDWLTRAGAPAAPMSAGLIERLANYQTPAGHGHIYVLGETGTIRRQRHDLLDRGFGKDQIFGEGYWRPGRVGGHDHLAEH